LAGVVRGLTAWSRDSGHRKRSWDSCGHPSLATTPRHRHQRRRWGVGRLFEFHHDWQIYVEMKRPGWRWGWKRGRAVTTRVRSPEVRGSVPYQEDIKRGFRFKMGKKPLSEVGWVRDRDTARDRSGVLEGFAGFCDREEEPRWPPRWRPPCRSVSRFAAGLWRASSGDRTGVANFTGLRCAASRAPTRLSLLDDCASAPRSFLHRSFEHGKLRP
jgi:hypothetical protein